MNLIKEDIYLDHLPAYQDKELLKGTYGDKYKKRKEGGK
jgi:hypothetical protein